MFPRILITNSLTENLTRAFWTPKTNLTENLTENLTGNLTKQLGNLTQKLTRNLTGNLTEQPLHSLTQFVTGSCQLPAAICQLPTGRLTNTSCQLPAGLDYGSV